MAAFFAIFRAMDGREFLLEAGNPESSSRPVCAHTRKMAAPTDGPGMGERINKNWKYMLHVYFKLLFLMFEIQRKTELVFSG